MPRVGSSEPLSFIEAIARGNTERAKNVLNFLMEADHLLDDAQDSLEEFVNGGSGESLKHLFDLVTRSGLTAVGRSFLFSATGHGSYPTEGTAPEPLIRFFSAHPIMDKRNFGKLLVLKFNTLSRISGADLLTGLFQQQASLKAVLEPDSVQDFFNYRKLAFFREWAEPKLDEWADHEGAKEITSLRDRWNGGEISEAAGNHLPDFPRDSNKWHQRLNNAARWLEGHWRKEIGQSGWVSENTLFRILKRALKPLEVVQHASPIWLSPQHLDIFIPEIQVAVEYMGEQHYEAVDFFGGESALAATQERDGRKNEICGEIGVDLHYVRYDEDMGERVRDILKSIVETFPKRDFPSVKGMLR